MADFTSSFWNWFIIIPSVGGIIGCYLLIVWMTEKRGGQSGKAKSTGHVWDGDLQELNNPLPKWWLNLFYITLVFGAVYLVLYPGLGSFAGLLGWSSTQRYEDELAQADKLYGPLYQGYLQEDMRSLVHDPEAMKTGARLYLNYCTVCHGSNASGNPGYPNLRDKDWLYGGNPEQIKQSIMKGRSGQMPPWEAALGGREGVFNVTEYVLSLSGRKVNINAAEAGKVKYRQLCVACHGADGKGSLAAGPATAGLGAPNLADNIWLYGGSQRTVMESIAKGRQGQMPAHAEFLGEAKVHLIAAYILSLSADNLTE